MMTTDQLISAYRAAGQGQVFAFWDSLSPQAREELAAQAAEVDLAEVERLNKSLVFKSGGSAVNLDGLAPAPYERLPRNGGNADHWAKAKATGETALRTGRVAAFTVAGGQGTRLGSDGQKGRGEGTISIGLGMLISSGIFQPCLQNLRQKVSQHAIRLEILLCNPSRCCSVIAPAPQNRSRSGSPCSRLSALTRSALKSSTHSQTRP